MRKRLWSIVLGLVGLGALAGCGTTTVDPKSGENLIRTYVKRNPSLTLTSVSCPSGVKPKDGNTLNCKVNIKDDSTNVDHKGTITVHITGGGKKVEILGAQDIHVQ